MQKTQSVQNSSESLSSLLDKLINIRNRTRSIRTALEDTYELTPVSNEKDAKAEDPSATIYSLNQLAYSVQAALTGCEDTITKIRG